MKDTACYSLETMLYFDIEGKAHFMRKIVKSTKRFRQVYSNSIFFDDRRFIVDKECMRPMYRY